MAAWIIAWTASRLSAYAGGCFTPPSTKLNVPARIGPVSTLVGVEAQPASRRAPMAKRRRLKSFMGDRSGIRDSSRPRADRQIVRAAPSGVKQFVGATSRDAGVAFAPIRLLP